MGQQHTPTTHQSISAVKNHPTSRNGATLMNRVQQSTVQIIKPQNLELNLDLGGLL